LGRWQTKILTAVGNNGQVLIDIIPGLERVIGRQPPVAEVGPQEAQNRFNLYFQYFIRAISRPGHPLVLFLDDLQWADSASLNLLKLILMESENRHLLLVGAFRDNEMAAGHPLLLALDELDQAEVSVNRIQVRNLIRDDVSALIADTLVGSSHLGVAENDQTIAADYEELAALVYDKTRGNAFFARQFLQALYEEDLLRFNRKHRRWVWDIKQIQARGITDNVVELMAGKIGGLPAETQAVLKLAACVGNRFDLRTLSVISEQSPAETLHRLLKGAGEGLIFPVDDRHTVADPSEPTDLDRVVFRFVHDRVQQAAYSLIAPDRKKVVHLQVGRLLLAFLSPLSSSHLSPSPALEERIFDVADQFNQGLELITAENEKEQAARLNLLASKKARAASAYQQAANYCQTGLRLLPADVWQSRYDLALEFHTDAVQIAYLNADFKQMDRLAAVVLARAKTVLDAVKVYEIKIEACMAQRKMSEGVQTALQTLALLDINIPAKPAPADIERGLQEGQAMLDDFLSSSGRSLEDLIDLPEMTAPDKLTAMRILSKGSSAAYYSDTPVWILLVLKQFMLSVQHGSAPISAYTYAMYGAILCGEMDDIEHGYRFGQLALKLMERFKAQALKVRIEFWVNAIIRGWKEHIRPILPLYLETYQSALEFGELVPAANAVYAYCFHLYVIGHNLEDVEREMALYGPIIRRLGQKRALGLHKLNWQVVLNLQGRSENPWQIRGEQYNEAQIDRLYLEQNYVEAKRLWTSKLTLCYLFQQYPQAIENADTVEKYLNTTKAGYTHPVFYFYDSLARLALYGDASEKEQKDTLARVRRNQQKMDLWARHAPMNYQHKFYLVEAEQARVLGRDGRAREYYDQAIELAIENEYLNEEALAYETAGRFYLARGRNQLAELYLRNAHYAYQRWGAAAKVKDMEARYPQWLAEKQDVTASNATRTSTGSRTGGSLDLATVMKAAQAISGEMVLDKLLARLMEIVIENAGAERGALLLAEDGEWMVKAQGGIQTGSDESLHIKPVGSELPAAIINYVTRTCEPVVLHDAVLDEKYGQDSTIVGRRPKSILCAPLLNRGRLSGVLYLENNLTAGAFTPDRVEILNLLSAQAAVAIENARLYTELQFSEKKYRTIFEDTKDVIFITTTDGRIVDVNPAFETLLGYTRQESLQLNALATYVNPDDRTRFREAIERQGMVKEFEVKLRQKDGREVDALITAALRQAADGSILGYQGIARDMTARKKAEQERMRALTLKQEKEAAEAASRAKSDFLASMNHELRTPLNAILGFTKMMSRDRALPAGHDEQLGIIRKSGEMLLDLINQLLDFSKVEAGHLSLDESDFDLYNLLDELNDMFYPQAAEKGLEILLECASDVPRNLVTDKMKLRQVLINLIGNGVKFTQTGIVSLRVKKTAADDNSPSAKSCLHFEIEDTGPGIHPDEIDQLFNAFTQTEIGRKSQLGTGLGLAISQKFVQLMGGTIHAYPVSTGLSDSTGFACARAPS